MNRLGNHVSIIYTYKSQEWIPPTGEYLSDLTDELSCKQGHWIVDFVSCRAKNYVYKLNVKYVDFLSIIPHHK